MALKVHHLACATICPIGARFLVNRRGRLICHCLLIEGPDGLILVDTALSEAHVAGGLGFLEGRVLGFSATRPEDAAARQVERLGFRREDVRDIVLTHLDLDHGGGLSDFPEARIHVHRQEHEAARARAGVLARARYPEAIFAQPRRWELYEATGEPWFGFASVRALRGLPDDILLVPLAGHSRGHCGVAVRSRAGWLLHCGDAYFHKDEMRLPDPRCTIGLDLFQRLIRVDADARVVNQARLRALRHERGGEVRLFCAHDPDELDEARAAALAAEGRAPAG